MVKGFDFCYGLGIWMGRWGGGGFVVVVGLY